MAQRHVEVFTTGCVVHVRDLRQNGEAIARAVGYGVTSVPAVAVDGLLASCSSRSSP